MFSCKAQDQTVKKDTLFFELQKDYIIKGEHFSNENKYFIKDGAKNNGEVLFFKQQNIKYQIPVSKNRIKSLKEYIRSNSKIYNNGNISCYYALNEFENHAIFFVDMKNLNNPAFIEVAVASEIE